MYRINLCWENSKYIFYFRTLIYNYFTVKLQSQLLLILAQLEHELSKKYYHYLL